MDVEWTNSPNNFLRVPRWKVLVPKGRTSVGGIVINDTITGAYVHFITAQGRKGQDIPCLRGKGCAWCPRGSRWKGWVPVWHPVEHKIYLLQISEGAWEQMYDAKVPVDELRGRKLVLSRRNAQKRGEVLVDIPSALAEPNVAGLPEQKDIRPNLMKIWDWTVPLDDSTEVANGSTLRANELFTAIPY